MHNELITIGNITIYGYGLMMAIGFITAIIGALYMAKKKGLIKNAIIDIALLALASGLLGAKILYCIVNIKKVIKNPSMIVANGGFVVYGGILFAILACYIYSKKSRLDFFTYADIILPHLFIAQGFGRIGCFLAGCCYGMEYDGIGHIIFESSIFAPNHTPLFPSQLCSSAFDMIMGIILITLLYKTNLKKGITTSLYLLSYGFGRFCIEFVRGDIERGMIVGITTSQFISIFVVLFGMAIFIIANEKQKKINK